MVNLCMKLNMMFLNMELVSSFHSCTAYANLNQNEKQISKITKVNFKLLGVANASGSMRNLLFRAINITTSFSRHHNQADYCYLKKIIPFRPPLFSLLHALRVNFLHLSSYMQQVSRTLNMHVVSSHVFLIRIQLSTGKALHHQ